jgi:hypothetical protein
MKKILALLLAFTAPVLAQSVQQSGNITPGHIASWITTGVIGDGGSVGGGATLSGSFTLNDMVCANATSSTPLLVDCGFSATGTNNWVGVQNLQGGGTSLTVATADNSTNIATTAWVRNLATTAFPLAQNDIFVGNASNVAVAVAMSGDCTIVAAGTVTCTKTNGVNFATSATTDTTVATNITSGTLPVARLSGITNTQLSGSAAISNANLATAPTVTFKCNPTGSTAAVQDCVGGNFAAIACPPNVTIEITGTGATFTLPTCNSVLPAYMEVEVVGGGGGPPGSGTTPGAGTAGNASNFIYNSVTYTANGGGTATAGNGNAGGAGGTATGCDENITGGQGGPSLSANTVWTGATGGGTTLSPGGPGGQTNAPTGVAGNTNTGAGGGAGGTSASVATSPAGGGGGTCRKTIVVVAGQTTATYTVGAVATGGTLGTTGGAGGNGAAGRIKIVSRWQ